MKKFAYLTFVLSVTTSGVLFGQQPNPDQNPNHQVSMDYYLQNRQELTANQGQTVQNTYKAYDWTTYKAEQKQQRQDRRYEFKKMRYQSRYFCSNNVSPFYYGPNNNFYNPYYSPYWYGAGFYSFFF